MLKQIFSKLNLHAIFILIVGYFTYFQGYQNPSHPFWDENYHIASAQKYRDGVMFMEPHPPLGKLLIALGEEILEPNKNLDIKHFTKTNYIKKYPKGYSFAGVRLFPTLFAMLSALLFFYILYNILKDRLMALLFTSLYLFDNAMIVHSRAAMLESTQLFFMLSSILYFLKMVEHKKYQWREYIFLSILMGLTIGVKLNGLIIILLFGYIFFTEYKVSLSNAILKPLTGLVVIAILLLSLMYIHISLGQKEGVEKQTNFLTMLEKNIKYMSNYSKGVPRYNPCKKGENGSLAYGWAFGNKCINYRWEKNGGKVKYLYLVPNPIIWLLGLIAMLCSFILVGAKYLYGLPIKDKKLFDMITLFSFIYLSYMFVITQLDRVMYLYHYFIPLIISLILLVLVFKYQFKEYIERKDKMVLSSIVIVVFSIMLTYYHFSPLTYYKAMDYREFSERIWFDHWQLKAIR